jgi:putative transposase
VAQQARNLVMGIGKDVGRFRFVIRDRDTKFTAAFERVVAAERIEALRTPGRGPRANAYAERWVGTVRREVSDRTLILGCQQLRLVLAEFADQRAPSTPRVGATPPLRLGESPVVVPLGGSLRDRLLG